LLSRRRKVPDEAWPDEYTEETRFQAFHLSISGFSMARIVRLPQQFATLPLLVAVVSAVGLISKTADAADPIRDMQAKAIAEKHADWGHWGVDPDKYVTWSTHSNRLIPVYTFGVTLDDYRGEKSRYRNAEKITELYGRLPEGTLNPHAEYCDQTDVFRLQQAAAAAGKKYVVLIVFDGMDWVTTRAAAIARAGRVGYSEGRGTGLYFQDYRAPVNDFGYFVTSPYSEGAKIDVDGQVVLSPGSLLGGYDFLQAGTAPWARPTNPLYLLAKSEQHRQAYTDSSSSASSMCTGAKIYNDSVNVDHAGRQVPTIAHALQQEGRSIGVVTSVPISHATPSCAYAQNVHRDDYQDLTRDLLGLPSISHRMNPLPGVDVLLGCGWGETLTTEKEIKDGRKAQGQNFVPGNRYLTDADRATIDIAKGGKYRIVERTPGRKGKDVLAEAARAAEQHGDRLFGLFGVKRGHLPYRTADGKYDPVAGIRPAEKYTPEDIAENPTLSDMAEAALTVLSTNPKGFWLMVEAGDVDWGNHENNIDNAIGAVHSGDDAFRTVVKWVETRDAWKDTAIILTADHGHYFVLEKPEALVAPAAEAAGQ
jgi:alkaline phosphatase